MPNFKNIGVRRSLLVSNPNTFIWFIDINGVKAYRQVSNSTNENNYTLVNTSFIYCEPKYFGIQQGVLSGTGVGLTITGLGTIIFTGNNTYTGITTITQGANLQIGNGGNSGGVFGNIQINSGGTLTFFTGLGSYVTSNALLGNGTLTLRGTGANEIGSFIFTGANTFTGQTILVNTRLILGTGSTTSWNGTSIIVNTGSQVSVNNFNLSSSLSLSGDGWRENAGFLGAIRYVGTNTISGNIALASNTSIRSLGATTHNLTITGVISGNANIIFGGGGTVTLRGSNTYIGNTTVTGGSTLTIFPIASFPFWTSNVINIQGNSIVRTNGSGPYFRATWNFDSVGGGTIDFQGNPLNGAGTGQGNTFVSNGGATNTISGFLNLFANTSIVNFNVANGGTAGVGINVTGHFSNASSTLNKSGAGLLQFSNSTDSFPSGNINITAGTIRLSGSGRLASTGFYSISSGATLDTSTVTTSSQIGSVTGAGNISIGTRPLTIANNGTTIFSGVFSGSALVTFSDGDLSLTGNSSKTGGWTINGGTLRFIGGTFGAGIVRGTLTINNGIGVIDLTTSGEPTYSNDIITVNAGGVASFLGTRTAYILGFNLNNNGTSPANVTANTNTVGIQGGNGVLGQTSFINSTGTGNGLVNNVACVIRLLNNGTGGSFTFNPTTAPLLISGNIVDFPGLSGLVAQKTGTGTLTLSGTNTNSGGFNLTAGLTNITGTNIGTFVVASGASISAGNVTTATVGNLTFSALASRLVVNAITTTSSSRLSCATLTASSNLTIDILGSMNSGTYTILTRTGGASPTPTLGTNTTGRTVSFSWSGNNLNMILT